jgi:hypothetical protein
MIISAATGVPLGIEFWHLGAASVTTQKIVVNVLAMIQNSSASRPT